MASTPEGFPTIRSSNPAGPGAHKPCSPEIGAAADSGPAEQWAAFRSFKPTDPAPWAAWGAGAVSVAMLGFALVHAEPRLLACTLPAAIAIFVRRWEFSLLFPVACYGLSHFVLRPVDGDLALLCVVTAVACSLLQATNSQGEWSIFKSLLKTESKRKVLSTQVATCIKIFQAHFDAVCFCDNSGVIRMNNAGMETLWGSDEESTLAAGSLLGRSVLDLAAKEEDRHRFQTFLKDAVETGIPSRTRISLQIPGSTSGAVVEADISGTAVPDEGRTEAGLFRVVLLFSCVEAQQDQSEQSADTFEAPEAAALAGAGGPRALARRAFSRLPSSVSEANAGLFLQGGEDEASTVIGGRAASCYSAPAILMQPKLLEFVRSAAAKECDAEDGDCLPPDAVVWLEGAAAPTTLSKVERGQKVLCFDRLSRGMKFAEITDVQTHDAMESEWVTVVLEDGTELEMTADHPVFPEASGDDSNEGPRDAVRAGELDVGTHSLEVLKMVPVAVKEVRACTRAEEGDEQSGKQPPTTRVALSVQQAERHSVFVAQGMDSAGHGMAVASASVSVDQLAAGAKSVRHNVKTAVKNTFIELVAEDGDFTTRRARAGSAPPDFWYADEDEDDADQPPAALLRRGQSTRSLASSFGGTSWHSSAISALTGSSVDVLLGTKPKERGFVSGAGAAPQERTEVARLSAALAARRAGLRSIGSLKHASGQCYPCLMQTWFHNGKCADECKFGSFCGRCHEPHTEEQLRKMRRSAKTRGPRQARTNQ